MLIKTSKKSFDKKLTDFLIAFDAAKQLFQKDEGIHGSRDITYAKWLGHMEQDNRELTTYINETTYDNDNYAKKLIRNFFSEHNKVTNMLLATKGVVFKQLKFTNEEIANQIVEYNRMRYKNVIAIRDYARACDSINFTGISQIYNIPEIENLSIDETIDLLLNRLYRIRDNENYFPLREILKGNGVEFNREETYSYLIENLQNENYIDTLEKEDDIYIRISMKGIHKMEQKVQKNLNRQVLKDALIEIKNNIPTTGIKKCIEKIKNILIDPNIDDYNLLIILDHRFTQLLEGEIKGILNYETITVERNKIANSLINQVQVMIDKLK